jgi:hypothetical protein
MSVSVTRLTPEELSACRTMSLDGEVTSDALKKRYRELSKVHHPDVGGDAEQFKKVNASYELLSKITPLVCTAGSDREFETVDSWLYGQIRRETTDSIHRRYGKYAPEGFTAWREHL